MINTTCVFLGVSSISLSSMFVKSKYFTISNSFFQQCSANKLFSPFFSVYSQRFGLQLNKCRFSHSLQHSIRVESISFNEQVFYSRISLADIPPIRIKSCFFYHISTLGNKGGALYIDVKYKNENQLPISLNHCGFLSCRTDQEGGGAFISATNVYLVGNCFDSCRSGKNNVAAKLSVVNVSFEIVANLTTIYMCSPNILSGQENSISFSNGNTKVSNINSSHNSLINKNAFASFMTSTLIVRYGDVCHNNGMSFLMCMGSPQGTLFQYNNFINNTMRGLSAFDGSNGNVEYSLCYFLQNTPGYDNRLCFSISIHGNLSIFNCKSDLKFFIYATSTTPSYFFENANTIDNRTTSCPKHAFIATIACWDHIYIETPKFIERVKLQWGTTITRAGSIIILCILAIAGKRVYQFGTTVRKKRLEISDTESLRPNESQYNFDFEFEVL